MKLQAVHFFMWGVTLLPAYGVQFYHFSTFSKNSHELCNF